MTDGRLIVENVLTVSMDPRRSVDTRTIVIEGGEFTELLPVLGEEPARRVAVPRRPGDRVIDGSEFLAIPGLINGHLHCDVVAARGLGDGLTLTEQNGDSIVGRNRWFAREMTGEIRRLSRRLQLAECAAGGTTFVCDVPFWPPEDGGWGAPFREVGIGGAVVVDYRRNFLSGERLSEGEVEEAMADLDSAGLVRTLGAPPEEGFDDEEMRHVFGLAERYDTLVHIHLAETKARLAMVRERFGTTPVRYLADRGHLGPRLLASHGVYIDPEELSICRDAGVRIVNTPVAEMKIADGIAPVPDWIREGLPLGVGTDGSMWNDASDLFGEMKAMLLLHRVTRGAAAISPLEVLELATCRGAEVFGLSDRIGSIEAGKRGDLVLLRRNRAHTVPLISGDPGNLYSNIVSCFRSGDVDTVISAGKIVVEGGVVKTVDEAQLTREMQKAGEELFGALSR
jgi:5-methylthioadenosine/S-adenosylhomocysteine deaminase